jgi:hypothetical protein
MKEKVRFLGLDFHAETIAVAIAEPEGGIGGRRGTYSLCVQLRFSPWRVDRH